MGIKSNDYIISRSTKDDAYTVWRFEPDSADLLVPVPLDPEATCSITLATART